MKTLSLQIEDRLYEGLLILIQQLPADKVKIIEERQFQPSRTDLEAIEKRCHAMDEFEAKRQAALSHIAAMQVRWEGKPIVNRDALYDQARG